MKKFSLVEEDELRPKGKSIASYSEVAGPGDAGNLQTFFNILTAFFGAAILAFPATFEKIGIIGGIIGMIIVGILNIYTMQL